LEENYTEEGINILVEMEQSLIRQYQDYLQEGLEC
jgi:hypothetical protein